MVKLIALQLEYNRYLILDPAKAPALLGEIAHCQVYKSEGYGVEKKYQLDESGVELTFLNSDDLLDKPDALQKALEDLDRRTKEYYGVISEKCNVEKQLKEVKAELERVKTAVQGND